VPDAIIYIDPDQPMNLQNQICQKLVDGILNGSFAPGVKLPSVAVAVSLLTQRKDPPRKLTNADGEAMDLSDRLGTLPLFRRAD
jgi:hypothetical protein